MRDEDWEDFFIVFVELPIKAVVFFILMSSYLSGLVIFDFLCPAEPGLLLLYDSQPCGWVCISLAFSCLYWW